MESIVNPRVLIIEDDQFLRELYKGWLESAHFANFDVSLAPDMKTGLLEIEQNNPEVVLFDLNLPDSKQAQTLEQVKRFADILPVLILTSRDDETLALNALKFGVQDYLVKEEVTDILLRRSIIYGRERHRLKMELKAEKKNSESLLLNILPKQIAEELKKNGKASARFYESATIMFSDFSGFTEYSELVSPENLVQELDICFSKFDELANKNGMEKIKTMGDAYMCVGGIPSEIPDHSTMAVEMALEMREFIRTRVIEKKAAKLPFLDIRIGIHTGPLTAGVVGKEKFAYDVWGDAVNVASRLESNSIPDRINISEELLRKVEGKFVHTYRGEIEVKGKGKMKMYFVESKV